MSNTSKKLVGGTTSNTNKAPALPGKKEKLTKEQMRALPVTDPRRKLTKEERKAMTPDQRTARKAQLRAARGPAKVRLHKSVMRLHKRAVRIAKMLGGGADADTAVKGLLALAGHVDGLDNDWQPKGGGGGAGQPRFTVGQMVAIKEERRAQFIELGVPKDEVEGMVVKGVAGKMVTVQAEGGLRLMIESRHLVAQKG